MTPLPVSLPSSPWQRFYAAMHRRRRRLLSAQAERLPCPLLSVGNIHWGGGGKTPLTIAIARHLRANGQRPGILSRGYGREGSEPLLVSDGDGPLHPPRLTGDEPWMMAEALPGTRIAVAGRRAEAGRLLLALEEPPNVLILDDGFSHVHLARDLDILAFPLADPLASGRLLPGGRLREPLAAVAHADAVVLTGIPRGTRADDEGSPWPSDGKTLAKDLREVGFEGPGFTSYRKLELLECQAEPSADIVPAPALLVSGVARPAAVRESAESLGIRVVDHLTFRDHHAFPERSLRRIERSFESARADGARYVLTTTKDRVKLAGRLQAPLVELALDSTPEPAFFAWLDCALQAIRDERARGVP